MTRSIQTLFDLTGRTALVTGGSRGLGLQIAESLGEAGAKILLTSRKAADLEESAAHLQAKGIDTRWIAADASAESDIQRIATEAVERLGQVDILVNNAGATWGAPAENHPVEAWDKVMNLNIRSMFLLSQAIGRLSMIPRQRGRIINVCSVQSELGRPSIAPYAATKGAVKMLTKGMAIDLGRYGIQVNGLGPGYFKTELTQALVNDAAFTEWLCNRTPSGRWGEVSELAGAAIFLASDAASFVNGHVLYVDGGITSSL